MYFNWRRFVTDTFHALFTANDPHMRITGHRARVLSMFYPCMLWLVGSGRLGLFLDRILFPQALKTPVKSPVFIIGNFRSGSTLLHRLLASDPQFTAMKTWEIYFAPSVSQRKFWRGFWMVDRVLGSPTMRRIQRQAVTTFGDVTMHRVSLTEPEEDEALLLFLWDSLFNWFFMPYQADANPYWRYDTAVPKWRRKKAMRFYRSCLQRQLFAHNPQAVYISKNPSFSAKLESLLEEFPDARIIYLVRHPADTLVSTLGWFNFAWHYFASPVEEFPFQETLTEMTVEWYRHPLAILDRIPESQYRIVRYEDLVVAPQKTVTDLLRHFGFTLGYETRKQLDDLENAPPVNKSHSVELAHVGMDTERIAVIYAEVLARFGYEV